MPGNFLQNWLGDQNELTQPKVLQMAKALRQRKAAVDNKAKAALSGNGNIFQRHKQGIEQILDEAN